ncbi:TonB family protein [Sandarakinorhabdus limnophila]|jgi:TonB family protein|uniref:TonB family protein n=1 Tax=Sandarakinorhabdus limnophila TaxID=210512 RepID=UPI0026EF0B45|nr:TonB family protein [Sandarakinorhabdus limnophila]
MKLMALLMLAQAVIAPTSPQPKKVILDRDAYPEAARDAGVEGDIAFDLAIDAKGVITGCTVTKGADQPFNLAADACALARANWKFLPARAEAGKKVPGTVHYAIAFRISRRCPPPDGQTVCVFL